MEQHAIPQNVSSYQFKLVGDMTLKQFFQLAGGILVGLIFYSAPLIGIIKWPFVITSVILGVALAFLPLEERPLERWIFAFFKAIYAPTEYFWAKSTTPAKFFQDETGQSETVATPEQAALKEYLGSANQKTGPLAKLEGAEFGFLKTLSGLFSAAAAKPTAITPPSTPVNTVPVGTAPLPSTPLPASAPAGATSEAKKEIAIPQTAPIRVVPQGPPHLVVEEKPKEVISNQPQITTHEVVPIIAGNEIISTKQAMFSVDAAPPNPPTVPNVIVGQVVDADRKIVEGAIMEIKDETGRPIRAIRSNKAGHFITVTPLENGRYSILTEKEGYEFTPVGFDAAGALIPPILVQGRRLVATQTVPAQTTNQPVASQPMQQT